MMLMCNLRVNTKTPACRGGTHCSLSAPGAPGELNWDMNAYLIYSNTALILPLRWADDPPYSVQLGAISPRIRLPEQFITSRGFTYIFI